MDYSKTLARSGNVDYSHLVARSTSLVFSILPTHSFTMVLLIDNGSLKSFGFLIPIGLQNKKTF
jgi:hypothetical protein